MAETDSRTGVGELIVLLPSWRLHLEASNLSPRTIRAYADDGALFAALPARQGMPTAVASIRREHVEAFIAAELARTKPSSAATRYRSLQQFFKLLDDEGEISGSPMVKMRPPITPEQPVPVLSDDQVRGLLGEHCHEAAMLTCHRQAFDRLDDTVNDSPRKSERNAP